jgi:hypothetical protein
MMQMKHTIGWMLGVVVGTIVIGCVPRNSARPFVPLVKSDADLENNIGKEVTIEGMTGRNISKDGTTASLLIAPKLSVIIKYPDEKWPIDSGLENNHHLKLRGQLGVVRASTSQPVFGPNDIVPQVRREMGGDGFYLKEWSVVKE